MTDLKTYLRRTDVEAMIQVKINGCAEKIASFQASFDKLPEQDRQTPDHPVALPLARRIADMEARKSALGAALGAIKFCEQFTLHDGHDSNEAGIAELRDAAGNNVEPDGRRWRCGADPLTRLILHLEPTAARGHEHMPSVEEAIAMGLVEP